MPKDWKKKSKCHSYLQEKQEGKPRELEVGQSHLNPEEDGRAADPGNHFQAHEQQKIVMRNSHHAFTKGRSCSITLITLFDEATGLVQVERDADIFYLHFSKVFDTVSCKILQTDCTMFHCGKATCTSTDEFCELHSNI